MLRWIALHGPIGSGKTTLAKALEATGEYTWINFGDSLKEMAVDALRPYRRLTVGEIIAQKEVYRGFLQEFAEVIGFSDDPYFVLRSLEDWCGEPAVFDNIRSPQQAETLRSVGFKVVKLACPLDVMIARRPGCDANLDHRAEAPLPSELVDVVLDATLPTEELARMVREL